jgi:hypothetical protein
MRKPASRAKAFRKWRPPLRARSAGNDTSRRGTMQTASLKG